MKGKSIPRRKSERPCRSPEGRDSYCTMKAAPARGSLVARTLLPGLAWLVLVTGCAPLLAGAAGAGVGLGAYAYVKGELEREYDASFDEVWQASFSSLRQMQIIVTSTDRDALKGVIKGVRADDSSVRLTIDVNTARSTSVGVRIGMFGDRVFAEALHEEIASQISSRRAHPAE